jgi:hypothetical protein
LTFAQASKRIDGLATQAISATKKAQEAAQQLAIAATRSYTRTHTSADGEGSAVHGRAATRVASQQPSSPGPLVVTAAMAESGLRVSRGPDWEWGDSNGGEGQVGGAGAVGVM